MHGRPGPSLGRPLRMMRRRLWMAFVLTATLVAADAARQPERQLGARVALAGIDVYQATVSRAFAASGVACRFSPTCSHYAEAFADFARQHGLAFCVPHFRGCSGELNLAPRAYHSGDFEEVGWILQRLRERHTGPIVAVGVSLGGNALLRWAQEMGTQASQVVSAVASVCSPIDLAASGAAIGRGFNRLVYTRMFINSMKPKALRKLAQHPGLFDRDALARATDLYEFDNIFTAPLHGFKNTEDYWARCSAKPHLEQIRIPALVVNALNDPFVPAYCLPPIATNTGGPLSFINLDPDLPTGWLVPPDDVAATATALAEAVSDCEMLSDRGRRAARFVREHYSWASAAEAFSRLYSELTDDRESSRRLSPRGR